ncbi:hypothetical protein GH714_001022 [Hevea brasiliensis]|uniref:UDP-3-O-[3-hydroxymyristoyl] glucosamine N-acyltransferase non-repeat region domain-containing protein n=1 Tax=Hevea brasiliensis TaxID=3981 RepID=A0A6A6LXP9_HEVBR|nr:hypothetical protein GH714_001022 [Hevea brasiliensis]
MLATAISANRLSSIGAYNLFSYLNPLNPFVEHVRGLCVLLGAIRYQCSVPSVTQIGKSVNECLSLRLEMVLEQITMSFQDGIMVVELSTNQLCRPNSNYRNRFYSSFRSCTGCECHVGSGTVIGPAVTVGQSTKIGYNVSLSNCTIGDSCLIHNGVCIGQDGFGFSVDEQGSMMKKPQLLNAKIGNHVEIGANTCIDRGSWRDTVIGDHSKIDNLVQIGHNVVIGKSCLLCGQVGIAGSVTIGDYVTLGGRVAVRDHASITSKVRLAANSCVTKDITEPGDYGGFPAVPIHQWRRQVANHSHLSKKSIS